MAVPWGIVSAHVTAVMPARSLKAHPDIGLRLLEHMSENAGAHWHRAMPTSPVCFLVVVLMRRAIRRENGAQSTGFFGLFAVDGDRKGGAGAVYLPD